MFQLDVDTVAAYNLKKYEVNFYRELTKKMLRVDHIVKRFTRKFKPKEATSITFLRDQTS
eukprot:snap_masked-scaffold_97-processed-gene-0.19-mRNA-1 protein AED:1.00 eAED:1.00 QI:0/0/0/0/1/1/2/0/59